jgi:bifunctional non-homologous end joining protein LigD
VLLPHIEPMLATTGPMTGEGWIGEVKWDGIRTLAYLEADGEVRLTGRSGTDYTGRFPEIAQALAGRGLGPLLLDGEIVVTGPDGGPSFALLQRRIHRARPAAVQDGATAAPALYVAFDVLVRGDRALLDEPYTVRREHLAELRLGAAHLAAPGAWPSVEEALAWTKAHFLEGVIAKKAGSAYHPGARSSQWRKLKHLQVSRVTIGGWLPGGAAGVRSLLIGIPIDAGLLYVGSVGSGLAASERTALAAALRRIEETRSPFTTTALGLPRGTEVRWARPVLQADVAYLEVTAAGRLRQPTWRGLADPHRADT